MTETPDNAGARLFSIMSRLKEAAGQPPLTAWAMALGIQYIPAVPPNINAEITVTPFDVLHAINETQKLIAEVERKIRSIEGIKLTRYLGPFSRLHAVTDVNTILAGNFHEALKAITDSDLTVLDFCAEVLERHYREPVVEQDQLRELLKDIDALFQEIADAEIEPDLKIFLLARIEEMRRGVVEYQIGGHERLKETLGKTFGMIMVNRDLVEANKDEPTVRTFGNLTGRLASLVSFTSDVASLVESAVKLLPGG
jgi:hypothetical protein